MPVRPPQKRKPSSKSTPARTPTETTTLLPSQPQPQRNSQSKSQGQPSPPPPITSTDADLLPTRPKPQLPIKQLTVLAICRLSEPICLTSIFSYLPQMIRSFNVPEEDVGFYAGITAASFSVAQSMTGIAWGRLSDRIGRKPTILFGFIGMLVSVLVFGFSTSIPMAMAARSATGLLNGNIGILRTIVAELVPERELQPRAFSLLPLVWSIGSIMGPIVGGFLSEPSLKYPTLFPRGSFFDRHPWALPNLCTGLLLFNAFLFGWLFLDETLVGKRGGPDKGREIGRRIEGFFNRLLGKTGSLDDVPRRYPHHNHIHHSQLPTPSAADALLSSKSPSPPPIKKPQPKTLPLTKVLTPQSLYNITLYFLIAIHVVSYDSILPVFLSTHIPTTKNPITLPFHLPGGFGLTTSQIGLIYSFNGITAMLLQFYLYPPIARTYGSVRLLAFSAAIYPVIYLLTPYTLAFRENKAAVITAWLAIIFLKSLTGVFAFTSSTILITNTARSIRVLGTLNGFATSVAAAGRAMGPSFFGFLFSVGQKGWWSTIPWCGLSVVAAGMWIWIPRLVEGKGLRGDGEEGSDDEDGGDTDGEESGGEDGDDEGEGGRLGVRGGYGSVGVEGGSVFDDGDSEWEDEDSVLERRLGMGGSIGRGKTRRLSMGSVNEQ